LLGDPEILSETVLFNVSFDPNSSCANDNILFPINFISDNFCTSIWKISSKAFIMQLEKVDVLLNL